MWATILPDTLAGSAQGIPVFSLVPLNLVRHVDLQFGMSVRTPTQTGAGVNNLLLITPVAGGVTQIDNALSFGSVTVNPLTQEQYAFITAPLGDVNLVSPNGTFTYKIETRGPNGTIVGSGTLTQATRPGAVFQCRVVGFEM
jgi:hypothetical protein